MSWANEGRERDLRDPLAKFRYEFVIDDDVRSYLDGNSLGRMPRAAINQMVSLQSAWGSRLIQSWNEGWYGLASEIGAKIAGLIGADPDEVIVADSTSVNLYKLAGAALASNPGRTRIASDVENFPSDLYILSALGPMDVASNADSVLDVVTRETALVSCSQVAFKSGTRADMATITGAVHDQGAQMIWDLSHSVGAIPIDLHAAGVELAVGCTYKFLNGGPGAPAFLYVARHRQADLAPPIHGWFGQDRPFDFGLQYSPAPGMRRWLSGTPPIFSLSCIEPGVDLLLRSQMDTIDAKRIELTNWLITMLDENFGTFSIEMITPRDPARRGSHVSIRHRDAYAICQALIRQHRVIPDFRAPDVIRFGVAPLYTSFEEVGIALDALFEVLRDETWRADFGGGGEVT